jgi:hypothetical protein
VYMVWGSVSVCLCVCVSLLTAYINHYDIHYTLYIIHYTLYIIHYTNIHTYTYSSLGKLETDTSNVTNTYKTHLFYTKIPIKPTYFILKYLLNPHSSLGKLETDTSNVTWVRLKDLVPDTTQHPGILSYTVLFCIIPSYCLITVF